MKTEQLVHAVRKKPEELIRFYAQAKTPEEKSEIVGWIGGYYKEKGLLALVDYLYSQGIGDSSIQAILKKYSLFDDIILELVECDAIISIVLEYLGTPSPKIDNADDEWRLKVDIITRESAARVLVVLDRYPNTSNEARASIRNHGNLIVTYHCTDRMSDTFQETPLSRYLSGNIN